MDRERRRRLQIQQRFMSRIFQWTTISRNVDDLLPLDSTDFMTEYVKDIFKTMLHENKSSSEIIEFLVGCYKRCCVEYECREETVAYLNNAKSTLRLFCRVLLVSHPRTNSVFDFSLKIEGHSPLLYYVLSIVREEIDNLFLDGFMTNLQDEDEFLLEDIFSEIKDLVNVFKVSNDEFIEFAKVVAWLLKYPIARRVFVDHLRMGGGGAFGGDGIRDDTLLGAFLAVTILPDLNVVPSITNVGCTLEDGNVEWLKWSTIYMNYVVEPLLEDVATRGAMLEYFAYLINKSDVVNGSHVTPMLLNFNAIILFYFHLLISELVIPDYLEDIYGIDVNIETQCNYMQLRTLHSLHPRPEGILMHQDVLPHQQVARASLVNGGIFTNEFRSIWFFMTGRSIRLGLITALNEYEFVEEQLLSLENKNSALSELEESQIEAYKFLTKSYEQQLSDSNLLKRALGFYRGLALWLISKVGGNAEPFKCVPQHFVEDAMTLLKFVSKKQLALVYMEEAIIDFVKFIVLLMNKSEYINSSDVREKMIKVLKSWAVRED